METSKNQLSVEQVLKEKYFDEMKADGQNESACKQGWIILYGLNSYLQKALPKAMQEYANQLVGDKEREYKKLQKENDGIKKYVRDVCSENKKKYSDNTAILVILQQIEESITWINPTVKQQPIK